MKIHYFEKRQGRVMFPFLGIERTKMKYSFTKPFSFIELNFFAVLNRHNYPN